ncbi:MAG: hypothetical protein WC824_11295 [Bacteroidota bacterium]|jgi:hypothetical protein
MDFKLEVSFRMDLTVEEFRLVSKALRGKLGPDEELKLAENLQRKMITERHNAYEHMLRESQKAMDNLAKSEESQA